VVDSINILPSAMIVSSEGISISWLRHRFAIYSWMGLDAPDGFNGVMVRSGVGLVDRAVIVVAPRGVVNLRIACEFLETERDGRSSRVEIGK